MATVVRGPQDSCVTSILGALEDYEQRFPGSKAAVYRQNSGAVRVRIVDGRFASMSRSQRHDEVWQFLNDRLGGDLVGEISVLVLLPPGELHTSLMNIEFEDPLPSQL